MQKFAGTWLYRNNRSLNHPYLSPPTPPSLSPLTPIPARSADRAFSSVRPVLVDLQLSLFRFHKRITRNQVPFCFIDIFSIDS